MSKRCHTALLVALVACSGAARPAVAQTTEPSPRVLFVRAEDPRSMLDLSAGYTLIRDTARSQTLPTAWITAVGVRLRPALLIVGEADGAYTSVESGDSTREYRTHAFMAGVRRYLPKLGTERAFAQALAGVACYCGSTVQPDGRYSRGLAFQVGAGFDVPLVKSLAARVQGDMRRVNGDGFGFSQFRLSVGGVVGIARH